MTGIRPPQPYFIGKVSKHYPEFGYAVFKAGPRGGQQLIAAYPQERIAHEVAEVLNSYADEEIP